MSFAYELGVKTAGLLEQGGEQVVGALNKIAPRSRPGLELATAGIAPRIAKMQDRVSRLEDLQKVVAGGGASVEGIDPKRLAERIAIGKARNSRVAASARNSRMGDIGKATLGLGVGTLAAPVIAGQHDTPAYV